MFALPVVFSRIGRDRLHGGNRRSAHFRDPPPRLHGIAALRVRWWDLRKQAPLPSLLPPGTSFTSIKKKGRESVVGGGGFEGLG